MPAARVSLPAVQRYRTCSFSKTRLAGPLVAWHGRPSREIFVQAERTCSVNCSELAPESCEDSGVCYDTSREPVPELGTEATAGVRDVVIPSEACCRAPRS